MIPYFAFHHTSSISYYRHFSISKVFPIFRHSGIICEQTYFTICIALAMQLFTFQRTFFYKLYSLQSVRTLTAFMSVRTCRIDKVDCFVVVVFPVDTHIIPRCFFYRKISDFLLCLCCRVPVYIYIIHQNSNAKKYIFF